MPVPHVRLHLDAVMDQTVSQEKSLPAVAQKYEYRVQLQPKTCYAWCNGTLSQLALADGYLGHVMQRIEGELIRSPARSHEWVLGSTEHV